MENSNHSRLQELIRQLNLLRAEMLELEVSGLAGCSEVRPEHLGSARNLMHYVALRRHDIRDLQSQPAELGLSSLGRTQSCVLSALDAVIKLLKKLDGSEEAGVQPSIGVPGISEGGRLLAKKTRDLFGAPLAERNVHIMVTMPPEAATNYELVLDLLLYSMDCMRINCAHDGIGAWSG